MNTCSQRPVLSGHTWYTKTQLPHATRVVHQQLCRPTHCTSSRALAFLSIPKPFFSRVVQLRRERRALAAGVKSSSDPSLSVSALPLVRSIHDVDNGRILGFGADLDEQHPGFHDSNYKQRRAFLAALANDHQIGHPIPPVDYTRDERAVWAHVWRELSALLPQHACSEYLDSLPLFDFQEDHVPQLQEVSEVLTRATGWRVRPVAGLMHPRHFLAGLAFKYFHSTQYMRHAGRPDYTPEPDLCHELIGHVPLLAHPDYADLIQAIGLASLHATTEAQIWHLTKCYWYTVEFGVVREQGVIKAVGAGILSSYGELENMAAGRALLTEFDPFQALPRMSYKDGFQQRYYVLGSFREGADKLTHYARSLQAGAAQGTQAARV